MVTTKRAPPPEASSTRMVCPWASTNALAMASPSPARPPALARLNIWKTSLALGRRDPGTTVLHHQFHQRAVHRGLHPHGLASGE